MDVRKCLVPSRNGGTLNSRRAAIPLVRLLQGMSDGRFLPVPQGVLPQNWGGTELIRKFTCMLLKTTVNDRRKSSSLPL
ncbi:hypothetical protein TNCV_1315411 [Trichonephila clavipes]|uniref:Uncharacterized protein n=1 Tax=Trichonephila clavipes TaxID=2585209 RepID=A0A8X6SSJ0_TRICX|nr:hypothetical protein TNCV_1315411 [Trichonephila clavipes]